MGQGFCGVDATVNPGIDVSKWDPHFNWSAYTWPYVFVKVSEGSVIDPLFDYHWLRARGKTKRGGYHFFRAYVNPAFAVGRFVEYLDGDPGELPPVLDLEARDEIDKRTTVSRALTWLIECERLIGIRPIVYTSQAFINDVDLFNYPDFAKYELWLAQYPHDLIYQGYTELDRARKLESILNNPSLLRVPSVPKPFKVMRYWQWTAKLSPLFVPGAYTGTGYKLAIDCNFEIGTVTEPEPQPEPEEPMQGRVTTLTNIRIGAGTAFADVGDLHESDIVVWDRAQLAGSVMWYHLTDAMRGSEPVRTTDGRAVSARTDCWAYGVNIEPIENPTPGPAPSLPVLQVTVSGEGYKTVVVDMDPE